jgi:hypothetical protein
VDGRDRDTDEGASSHVGSERDWVRLSVLLRATTERRDGRLEWLVEGREPTPRERELLQEVTSDDLRTIALLRRHASADPLDGEDDR